MYFVWWIKILNIGTQQTRQHESLEFHRFETVNVNRAWMIQRGISVAMMNPCTKFKLWVTFCCRVTSLHVTEEKQTGWRTERQTYCLIHPCGLFMFDSQYVQLLSFVLSSSAGLWYFSFLDFLLFFRIIQQSNFMSGNNWWKELATPCMRPTDKKTDIQTDEAQRLMQCHPTPGKGHLAYN